MCILCSIICAHYLLPNNLCKRFFLEIKLRFGLRICIFFFMRFALCRGQLLLFTHWAILFTHCNTTVYAFKSIKNEFYGTIHIFKIYFVTVFSVFSFQFQQNKFYPHRPWEHPKVLVYLLPLYARDSSRKFQAQIEDLQLYVYEDELFFFFNP